MTATGRHFFALPLGLLPMGIAPGTADLIIRRARIVDGTGRPAFEGDIAVGRGQMVTVGEVAGRAAQEMDAAVLVAAPGFVDVHTHCEGLVQSPHQDGQHTGARVERALRRPEERLR